MKIFVPKCPLNGSAKGKNFALFDWTACILLAFSFIVTCKLLLGNSFICFGSSNFPANYVNHKCYSEEALYKLHDPTSLTSGTLSNENLHYYPWVNLFFLLQAFIFVLPHFLWNFYERGYISKLTTGLQDYDSSKHLRFLSRYVFDNVGSHLLFTVFYICVEACYAAVSILQTLWLVSFFEITGVPQTINYKLESWSDYRNFYFPSMVKCTLKRIGSSGIEVTESVLCNLSLNLLFMYMYLFLYAWYIFITVITGLLLLCKLASYLSPKLRFLVTKSLVPKTKVDAMECTFVYRLSFDDWFFLISLRPRLTVTEFLNLLEQVENLYNTANKRNKDALSPEEEV